MDSITSFSGLDDTCVVKVLKEWKASSIECNFDGSDADALLLTPARELWSEGAAAAVITTNTKRGGGKEEHDHMMMSPPALQCFSPFLFTPEQGSSLPQQSGNEAQEDEESASRRKQPTCAFLNYRGKIPTTPTTLSKHDDKKRDRSFVSPSSSQEDSASASSPTTVLSLSKKRKLETTTTTTDDDLAIVSCDDLKILDEHDIMLQDSDDAFCLALGGGVDTIFMTTGCGDSLEHDDDSLLLNNDPVMIHLRERLHDLHEQLALVREKLKWHDDDDETAAGQEFSSPAASMRAVKSTAAV